MQEAILAVVVLFHICFLGGKWWCKSAVLPLYFWQDVFIQVSLMTRSLSSFQHHFLKVDVSKFSNITKMNEAVSNMCLLFQRWPRIAHVQSNLETSLEPLHSSQCSDRCRQDFSVFSHLIDSVLCEVCSSRPELLREASTILWFFLCH